jgi:hypothetical protein
VDFTGITTDFEQPGNEAKTVSILPLGILIMLSPDTVPNLEVTTTEALDFVKNIEYAVPVALHFVPPIEINCFSQGSVEEQFAGLETFNETTQVGLFEAIIVTLVPTAIPITLFPEIVPEETEIKAPVISVKLNSQVVPLQTPFPATSFGVTHAEELLGQSTFGVFTFRTVVQPVPFEAVIVTAVFFGTPITLSPLTVPAVVVIPCVAFEVNVNS